MLFYNLDTWLISRHPFSALVTSDPTDERSDDEDDGEDGGPLEKDD